MLCRRPPPKPGGGHKAIRTRPEVKVGQLVTALEIELVPSLVLQEGLWMEEKLLRIDSESTTYLPMPPSPRHSITPREPPDPGELTAGQGLSRVESLGCRFRNKFFSFLNSLLKKNPT